MQRSYGRGILSLQYRNNKTVLRDLFQDGSARIFFPYTNRETLQAVLINTTGGMTGGDHLIWKVRLDPKTSAVITSQAAEKIYRSLNLKTDSVKINVDLSIEAGARLCWIPQETILFDCSHLERTMEVNLTDNAEFFIVETVILGRKLMGETIKKAFFKDNWRVLRNGVLLHAEALHFGIDMIKDISLPVFLNGASALATLLLIAPKAKHFLKSAREIAGHSGGASEWNGKLIMRVVDTDSQSLRKRLVAFLRLLLNKREDIPILWS